MSNGQGCTCNAWAANECACGADWTPQEVYDLRAENNRLKAENKLYAAEMSAAKENGFYSAQELFMAYKNMEAELAEAKKDADRFVALATEMLQKGDGCVWMRLEHLADRHDKEGTTPSINEMREAIDAAMKGK